MTLFFRPVVPKLHNIQNVLYIYGTSQFEVFNGFLWCVCVLAVTALWINSDSYCNISKVPGRSKTFLMTVYHQVETSMVYNFLLLKILTFSLSELSSLIFILRLCHRSNFVHMFQLNPAHELLTAILSIHSVQGIFCKTKKQINDKNMTQQ